MPPSYKSLAGAPLFVRYYGYYSNVIRGKRQQEGIDDAIPCFSMPDIPATAIQTVAIPRWTGCLEDS